MQQVKLPLGKPDSCIRAWVPCLAAPLPMQFPSSALQEPADNGPRVWEPATCTEGPDSVFWLSPDPILDVVVWDVN